ncbi:hypothetical protein SVIOM74S_04604 [Streptomyces violarus]
MRGRALALGLGAGFGFGVVEVAVRLVDDVSPGALVRNPAVYGLLLGGAAAFLLLTSALQKGLVTTATAGMVLGETVGPALVGVVWLGDGTRAGLGWLAVTSFRGGGGGVAGRPVWRGAGGGGGAGAAGGLPLGPVRMPCGPCPRITLAPCYGSTLHNASSAPAQVLSDEAQPMTSASRPAGASGCR